MRIIHISDIHIGKRVNEFSMIEDQRFILKRILNIIDDEKADAVLIAGDVYDKSLPSDEAVAVFDDFLNRLASRRLQVYIISGNHDSAVKLSCGAALMHGSGIHIAPVYTGEVCGYELGEDIMVYMLPFIKPAVVRQAYPERAIENYTDAVRVALEAVKLDESKCNILLSHQFVTGSLKCESEEIVVGGLDNIDGAVYDGFDYVALGHIHGPQSVCRPTMRYCGTPLKYSFSEEKHKKSVTVLDIEGKSIDIRTVELKPLHDMRTIRGTYEELTNKANYENTDVDDYLQVILTDEEEIIEGLAKLRVIYKNICILRYDNKRTGYNNEITEAKDIEEKSQLDMLKDFYYLQNNQEMSKEQLSLAQELIQEIWG